MKKYLLVYFLVFFVQISVAQISRTIYGVTLGTEYKTLIKSLKRNHVKYIDWTEDDKCDFITINSGTPFCGVSWLFTSAFFMEGKVNEIRFTDIVHDEELSYKMLSSYQEICSLLKTKYESYGKDLDFKEIDDGANAMLYLSDGKTDVTFILIHRPHGESKMQLRYEDVTWKQSSNKMLEEISLFPQ